MQDPFGSYVVVEAWLLREIELAGLTIHPSSTRCWTHQGKRRATLYLPLTKMDQRGRGAARTWECLCGGPDLPDGPTSPERDGCCPVCTVWAQVEEVEKTNRLGRTEERARKVPLFPTRTGGTATKKDVVRAWNELLTEASLEWSPAGVGETAPLECMGVDGHSPRRSGAKLLIRIGFGRGTVAFVGRWGSDAIMVYIEEVTIIGAALAMPNEAEPEQPEPPEVVKRAERPESQEHERIEELIQAWQDEVKAVKSAVDANERQLLETEDRVRRMEATVSSLPTTDMVEGLAAIPPGDKISQAELEARLATLQRGPRYVADKDAPMYHVVASAHPLDSPVWHRTRCG